MECILESFCLSKWVTWASQLAANFPGRLKVWSSNSWTTIVEMVILRFWNDRLWSSLLNLHRIIGSKSGFPFHLFTFPFCIEAANPGGNSPASSEMPKKEKACKEFGIWDFSDSNTPIYLSSPPVFRARVCRWNIQTNRVDLRRETESRKLNSCELVWLKLFLRSVPKTRSSCSIVIE